MDVRRKVILVFGFLLYVHISRGSVWEFGKYRKNSILISHHEGEIPPEQQMKVIPLKIDTECFKITYVKVHVMNPLTSPEVKLNNKTKKVTIYYITAPELSSQYDIIVKGIRNKECDVRTAKPREEPYGEKSEETSNDLSLPASYKVTYV